MKKYPLVGVSIIAVAVLILASLSNVVGFQTVQSSNQKVISDEIDQKELLFQTILDLANNKEIQQIILKSQISRQSFFNPDVKLTLYKNPVLTKSQLRQMYFIGLMLSKVVSNARMHSIIGKCQFSNPRIQQEINAVLEKDTTLNREVKQLTNSECECEYENTMNWSFPVICIFLAPLALVVAILYLFSIFLCFGGIDVVFLVTFFGAIWESISNISHHLNCFWTYP
jgi:hypothetical protein